MIYSKWRPELGHYEYYETTPKPSDVQTPTPALGYGNRLGLSPEEASWRIPFGAKKVGHGDNPKGMVALGNSSFGFDVNGPMMILSTVGGVLGAYHGYKRNSSVGWAFGWSVFGSLVPFLALPVAFAQGFGKKK
jgi:hypothetical protein